MIAMRTSLISVLLGLAVPALASNPPRGTLIELHSCEVYAGGCVVSSQATLEGRHLVRAWNFTGGAFAGTPFSGLQLAVVQTAPENLAAPGSTASDAVVYLPEQATPEQRSALLSWARAQFELRHAKIQTRTVPLQFEQTERGYAFTAGNFVALDTASLESCETQACGEALWYKPRTESSVFTVAVNRSARVNEPLLQLNWADAGKRSVFLARFGQPEVARQLYVNAADLCGPSDNSLF